MRSFFFVGKVFVGFPEPTVKSLIMKNLKISFLIITIGLCCGLKAQWSGTGPVSTFDDVGINTSNPIRPLDIHGITRISDFSPRLEFYDKSASQNQVTFTMFSTGANSGEDFTIESVTGSLRFLANAPNPHIADLIINTNGHVGIGTNTPEVPLDVRGIGIGTIRSRGGSFQLYQDQNSRVSGELRQSNNDVMLASRHGNLSFATSSAGSLNTKMRIFTDGNVSIGTSNNTHKLRVQGDTYFDGNSSILDSLGIGTTSPQEKLHVSGDVLLRNVKWSNFGFTRIVTFNGTKDLGFHGNGTLSFHTNGSINSELLHLTTDHKIGIGTRNPVERLEVNGAINLGFTSSTNNGTIRYTGGNFQGYVNDTWINLDEQRVWNLNGSAAVYDSGDVGIGTTSPSQQLDVAGGIEIGNTNTGTNGAIRYNGTNFQGYRHGNWINLDEAGGTPVWSQTGSDAFYSTGRIGIGTSSPSSRLHVDALSGQNAIRAAVNGSTKFHVSSNGGTSIGTPSAPPGNGLVVSGDTGIGTVSPAQKLEVVGAIKIGNTTSISNGSIRYDGTNFQGHTGGAWVNLNGSNGGTVWNQSGSDVHYNSGNVGIGTTNPAHLLHVEGDVAVAGFIIGPSDRRLKQDVQPIEQALDIVSSLQPKSYTYKTEQIAAHGLSDKLQFGLIAQELEEVLPSLISEDALVDEDGTGYKGIAYDQLIPILTQALKELIEDKTNLEQRVDELLTENVALKNSTRTISSRLDQLELLLVRN